MDLNSFIREEKIKILIMLLILFACSIITYYFQFILHVGTVFTHFFYIPIFLAVIWWKRWGLVVPIFMALILVLSHSLAGSLNFPISDDYFRGFMFIFVGLIVTILSERISESGEMLRKSEEKFTSLVHSAFEAIITIDKEGKIISWNRGAENIFLYSSRDMINQPLTLIMPERFIKHYENSLDKDNFESLLVGKSLETSGLKSDGTEFPLEMSMAQWELGDEKFYTAIIHDISDCKMAEKELKIAKNRLEVIFEEAPDAYFLIDMDGEIIDGNKASEKLSGYKKEELIGKNLLETGILPKSEIGKARKNIAENAAGHSTGPDEFVIETKEGKQVPTEIMSVPVNFDGQKLVLGLARDISQRKNAERALNRIQKRFLAVAESAVDGIVTTDTDGKIVLFNKSLENIFGYNKEELVNQPITILMPERNRKDFQEKVEKFRATGEHILAGRVMETKGLRKDGSEFPFEMSLATWNADGETFSTSIIRDITQRKKAEYALKESEEKYRTLIESAKDPISVMDSNGIFILANQEGARSFNMDPSEMAGKSLRDILPETAEKQIEYIRKVFDTGEGLEVEMPIEHGGIIKWFSTSIQPLFGPENNVQRVQVISRDVTDMKEAQIKLEEALELKDTLMKEIHHRVKNNLMVISSLLNLQSRYIKDKESLDIFRESQNRAQSMALIHERLYRSTDLKRIDFGEYIKSLSLQLFQTYVVDATRVNLKFNVEEIMLDINTTIPLGLIVNELVSNSMKYAFPEGRMGEIKIDFHEVGDLEFELIVKDNGIGFPKDIDFKNTESLGLQLVNSLTGQIDGTIQLDTTKGTTFIVRFKEKKYNSTE